MDSSTGFPKQIARWPFMNLSTGRLHIGKILFPFDGFA